MTDTERLIGLLPSELDAIRQSLLALRQQVSAEDATGTFFIERFESALESTVGCILLAKGGLAYPVAILARSMLELTMVTFWAASSPERALEASSASVAEITRILKSLLTKGHGKLVNKKTGEDKTAWSIRSYLRAIQFTVAKHITQKQATSLAELDGFLKAGLVPPPDQS